MRDALESFFPRKALDFLRCRRFQAALEYELYLLDERWAEEEQFFR